MWNHGVILSQECHLALPNRCSLGGVLWAAECAGGTPVWKPCGVCARCKCWRSQTLRLGLGGSKTFCLLEFRSMKLWQFEYWVSYDEAFFEPSKIPEGNFSSQDRYLSWQPRSCLPCPNNSAVIGSGQSGQRQEGMPKGLVQRVE